MKKIKWKVLIITSIVCLIPILMGIVLYNEIPEQIAIHFNMNNEPDSYASKEFAIFAIPIMLTGLQIFCCIVSDINENEKFKRPKFITIIKWFIPILSIVLNTIIIQIAIGNLIDVRKSILILIGITFILTGNYIPKINFENAKILIHPAPKNEKLYIKLSRTMGYTFVIYGICLLISIFLKPLISAITIIILIITIIAELIYFKLNERR